jgi:hypothetical protein
VFYATLADASNNIEIVKVTARAADAFTIARAQEGTTAHAYTAGDRVELRLTAAGLSNKVDKDTPGTLGGKLTTFTPAATAGLNLPHGSVPSSSINGDLWTTASGLFAKISAVVKTIAFTDSSITGQAGSVANAITFSNTGGAAPGASFDGSVAKAIDYTTIGAAAKNPAGQSLTTASTVTPTFSNDYVDVTAQASALTLANPTGTAVNAWGIVIRIKDNGSAQTIAYGTQYRGIGLTLPTTTVASKVLVLGMIYNSAAAKWDVLTAAKE